MSRHEERKETITAIYCGKHTNTDSSGMEINRVWRVFGGHYMLYLDYSLNVSCTLTSQLPPYEKVSLHEFLACVLLSNLSTFQERDGYTSNRFKVNHYNYKSRVNRLLVF